MTPGLAMAFHRHLDKLMRGIDLPQEERYIFYRSYYTQEQLLSLYTPDVCEQLKNIIPSQTHLVYFKPTIGAEFLNRTLYVDLKTFLTELNLTYSDKMSMAASVEVRVPLLDLEIVEFMANVPTSFKINRFTTKYLLRQALRGIVPDEIIKRRKTGFGAPIRKWLSHDLHPLIETLLSNSSLRARGILTPKAVRKMIDDNQRGIEDHTYRIWSFLTLEIWMRTFVDRQQPSDSL
jgi:asparagine synthase (glutamine-hydrolysing)